MLSVGPDIIITAGREYSITYWKASLKEIVGTSIREDEEVKVGVVG